MRMLSPNELRSVAGGDTAPTCTVMSATITGSNGVSATVYTTVCSCPAGTSLETTTSGNTVKATCKSD
jgi:hypothetical protein